MIIYLIHLKLTYVFLLFIIFILDPALFILAIEYFILTVKEYILEVFLFVLKSGFVCIIRITHIYNLILAKKPLWLELIDDVNEAMIATFYNDPAKCITAIAHNAFSEEDLLIVEEYDDEVAAKTGHKKWIETFKAGLPNELRDITDNKVYKRKFEDYCEDCFEEDFE
jgi:hypothetical protein